MGSISSIWYITSHVTFYYIIDITEFIEHRTHHMAITTIEIVRIVGSTEKIKAAIPDDDNKQNELVSAPVAFLAVSELVIIYSK